MSATNAARSRLPLMLAQSNLDSLMSFDAQLYGRCPACGFEHHVSPHAAMSPELLVARFADQACLRCDQGGLEPVRHVMRLDLTCEDCGTTETSRVMPSAVLTCASCGSGRVTIAGHAIAPLPPPQFADLTELFSLHDEEPHVWGVSGFADGDRLAREGRDIQILPEAHRHLYALILFAYRLLQYGEYDNDGAYGLANATGNLEQAYFRATGDLQIGGAALTHFEMMMSHAPNEIASVLALHSYAMGAFSLLAKWPDWYVEAMTSRTDLRATAVARAWESANILTGDSVAGQDGAASQLARVQWVIGDLLASGDADDDQLRVAIQFFDLALENEQVRTHLGFGVTESRTRAILALSHPRDEEIQCAVSDLSSALSVTGDRTANASRWRLRLAAARLAMRLSDDRFAGLEDLQESAALAVVEYRAIMDESQVIFQADQYAEVFELLAYRYINYGWNDEALTLVELVRGASLRVYTMTEAELSRRADEARESAFSNEKLFVADVDGEKVIQLGLMNSRSSVQIDDYLEKHPIGPTVTSVLSAHRDVPTAYVMLQVTYTPSGPAPVASALVCWMPDEHQWMNKRWEWQIAPEDHDLLTRQRYSPPGPFRERLLRRACEAGSRALLEPLRDLLDEACAQRLIVSLPGALSRLPIEAFPEVADHARSVTYLPSVRIGGDLIGVRRSPGTPERVLALGYAGEDMPWQQTELDELSAIWGERLTALPGAECTKRSVLAELQGDYDLIHIACHGTFVPALPLESRLHFDAQFDDDSRCVSARDLVDNVRLTRNPLIVLSACSSAVCADSRTNTYHGLAGSLFRIGAHAVVGSRWPVEDRSAAALMADFHRRMSTGQRSADLLLQDACLQRRGNGAPVEDWAAFAYLGVV